MRVQKVYFRTTGNTSREVGKCYRMVEQPPEGILFTQLAQGEGYFLKIKKKKDFPLIHSGDKTHQHEETYLNS